MPESQKIIAQALDLTLQTSPKETHQKDESVRLAVSFSKEDWETLLKARELLSHTVGSSDWAKVFSYLGKKVVQRGETSKFKDNAKTNTKIKANTKNQTQTSASLDIEIINEAKTNEKPNKAKSTTSNLFISAAEVWAHQENSNSLRKNIPLTLKRKIFNRDKCCQLLNKATGRVCGSRWNLEVDHIKPVWAKGSNDETNLRVLCGSHNRYIYRKQVGIYHG